MRPRRIQGGWRGHHRKCDLLILSILYIYLCLFFIKLLSTLFLFSKHTHTRTHAHVPTLFRASAIASGRAIIEIAEDVKKYSSNSRNIDNATKHWYDHNHINNLVLRSAFDSTIDKSEFSRLVETSKVLSNKDGKEPLKWDWAAIEEIFERGFQNKPERLSEVVTI